jgi:hypothetical protein
MAARGGPIGQPRRGGRRQRAARQVSGATPPPRLRPRPHLPPGPLPTPPRRAAPHPRPRRRRAALTLEAAEPRHVALAAGVLQPAVGVVLHYNEAPPPAHVVERRAPRRAHRRAGRVLARGDRVDDARHPQARGGARREQRLERVGAHALPVHRHGQQLKAARGAGEAARAHCMCFAWRVRARLSTSAFASRTAPSIARAVFLAKPAGRSPPLPPAPPEAATARLCCPAPPARRAGRHKGAPRTPWARAAPRARGCRCTPRAPAGRRAP